MGSEFGSPYVYDMATYFGARDLDSINVAGRMPYSRRVLIRRIEGEPGRGLYLNDELLRLGSWWKKVRLIAFGCVVNSPASSVSMSP
jgi:hypothetical protein